MNLGKIRNRGIVTPDQRHSDKNKRFQLGTDMELHKELE